MTNISEKSTKIQIAVLCFATNISQLPILVERGLTTIVAMPLWVVALLLIVFKNRYKLKKEIFFLLVMAVLFLIGQCLATIINGNDYLITSLSYPFYLSIFMVLVIYFYSGKMTEKDFGIIAAGYISSTAIVAFAVYFTYFRGGFDWNSIQYVYSSKNSVSQIIFTAITLLIFCIRPTRKYQRVFKYAGVLLFTVFLLALRSRASILGLLIIIIIVVFFSRADWKIKALIMLVIVGFAIALFSNDSLYNFLVNNILLGNRDIKNLDEVSSGRLDILSTFPSLIEGNGLLGAGNRYYECFYLAAFLQHGYIFGSILIIVAIYPAIWAVRHLRMDESVNIMFLVLAVSYCVNGIFEGVAPLGPGVKCYFVWLMLGLMLKREHS
ncbi:O-Antigen ligase [Parasporobacterium paucivorans DSM 15970]|uniref:O-Antigen ligase n=2 Tax=Parasporobacterium TaxID=115543 RepID=A0A1M6GUC6_9FIRM|nr:O-Antigen ligase [Parasporobacterium paucivorans DSM 15970]